jgi:hypothetical protein
MLAMGAMGEDGNIMEAGLSESCMTCIMGAFAGGERRLLGAWARKLASHETVVPVEGGMPAEMMACFGLEPGMSEEQLGVAMIAQNIDPAADCQEADLTVIMGLGADAEPPLDADAAVALGISQECATCMLAGGRRLAVPFRKLASHGGDDGMANFGPCFGLSDEILAMMADGDDDDEDGVDEDGVDEDGADEDGADEDGADEDGDDDDDDATSSAAAFALLVGYFA